MFCELGTDSFHKILPLYLEEKIVFPLILAVIQQSQQGWILADDPLQPKQLVVVTKYGFIQFSGAGDFDRNAVDFFMSPKQHFSSYILWYSPPIQAQTVLDRLPDGKVRRRERVRFAYENQQLSEDTFECPAGFYVRHLDTELIEKASYFKLEIGSRFWASNDDFLENGIGTCVVKDGEVVSLCYSACVVDNLAEIDIVTQEEYRGMGIAAVAAQSFIAECLRHRIAPTWDCFSSNTASMKLARKLGFVQKQSYYLYSFNVPIQLFGV